MCGLEGSYGSMKRIRYLLSPDYENEIEKMLSMLDIDSITVYKFILKEICVLFYMTDKYDRI